MSDCNTIPSARTMYSHIGTWNSIAVTFQNLAVKVALNPNTTNQQTFQNMDS